VNGQKQTLFETPEWRGNPTYEVGLRLRREGKNDGALLIKYDASTQVRRYSPDTKMMAVVGLDAWERAAGAIAVCEEQFPPDSALLGTNAKTGRLRDRQGDVPTVGRTILNLTAAPQGDRIAVLSATGKKPASPLPFWGSSGASGEYWHQVWSLRERVFFGPDVRISTLRARDSLRACWSADERLVVYYEVTFAYLLLVSVN
jgi:hypothetical protein